MNGDVGHSEPEPPSLPRKILLERGSEGYGFNLHGEKGIHGQFISAVDEGSPAQLNDVRVGDRVIGVNDEDVEDFSHSKVVEKIRSGGNKVTLLLVDEECDKFYKNLGVKIPQDKFETVGEGNAVPDTVQDKVTNGGEDAKEENGDVTDSGYNATAAEVVEEKTVQGSEENTEDGNKYEEVIPETSPSESVNKPVETTTSTTTTVSEEAPSNRQEEVAVPSSGTGTSVEPERSQTTMRTEDRSPQFDMEAARPKPKRNEVKRTTQNWKQKYDDFNKL